MRTRSILVIAILFASLPLIPGPAARADHGMPALDPTKMDYTPIGYYGPPDEAGTPAGESATVPNPSGGPPLLNDPNPSGKWVAYDTNVWESLTLPGRHPGDNCNSLQPADRSADCLAGDLDDDSSDPMARTGYTGYAGPMGTSAVHGRCPPPSTPVLAAGGECFNNQLEYLDYYQHSMETMLEDMGVVVKRYPFQATGARGGPPVLSNASGGQAYNIAAIIPGADHPEETVIVGAHYDYTDAAPAPAWDSSEGHTEVMRMAYIMADYYRKTGTRPSATIKFMPWDAEESGTLGSQDYVNNNIPPGETDEVRGYFNVDPCAGAYPAFEEGTNRQVRQVLQLSNPAAWEDDPEIKARMESFNETAETVIDQVLDYLDDRITRPTGEVPIFVSNAEAAAGVDDKGSLGGRPSDRGRIVTALGGLALFTSDYGNFDEVGIPIFNLFPDYMGPHADDTPSEGGVKGLEILHTNNDNLLRINRLSSGLISPGNLVDPTGTFASEGWAKGMEFCAQVEAWGMLQPQMVGTQTVSTDPVAYFEALPNESLVNQHVTFDAGGTYQYSNSATRAMEPESALTYQWDFGDGTNGTGKVIDHPYTKIGKYTAKLTVTGAGDKTDTMTIPITVIGSNFGGPVLEAITPADAEDGNFNLAWEFEGDRAGFEHYLVEESTDYRQLFADPAEEAPDTNWEITAPTKPGLEPWQRSNSGTTKFNRNQAHQGSTSFWTGVQPSNFGPRAPLSANSILTLKNPITVPNTGDPELQFWSLFQSEGDDQGRTEVAQFVPGTPPDQLQWNPVDVIQAVNTAAGGPEDHRVCDPSNPNTVNRPFESKRIALDQYKGKQILVRFNYFLGAEDRALSQPCGWYVDAISLSTGTWSPLGTSKETQFPVTERPNGLYAYRVKGVYADGVSTSSSNVEIANVTNSKSLPTGELGRCLKATGNVILGGATKDRLIGTKGKDVLCAFNGKDTINGKGGNDVIFAGGGNDKARGGAGNDRIFGEKGKDVLSGAKGNDKLKGGPKRDMLKGGAGNDKCGSNAQDTQLKC